MNRLAGLELPELISELIDIESVSLNEAQITEILEEFLFSIPELEIIRIENSLVAKTNLGHKERVILAGHTDTVPLANNIPHIRHNIDGDDCISGLGATDMKSGLGVFVYIAGMLTKPDFLKILTKDLTFIFYEAEEISKAYNGLGKIEKQKPDLLKADLAILGEPTNGIIEAGCQGVVRGKIVSKGIRSHAARSWAGDNAISKLSGILKLFAVYEREKFNIDGCEYKEGLSAVKISGGTATNVVPDSAEVYFSYRFAPHRNDEQAKSFLKDYFASELTNDIELIIDEVSPGALPGLNKPAAAKFVEAAGGIFGPKFGWTDVCRFSALGIPALNYAPGDPELAHKPEEYVKVSQIYEVFNVLQKFLTEK